MNTFNAIVHSQFGEGGPDHVGPWNSPQTNQLAPPPLMNDVHAAFGHNDNQPLFNFGPDGSVQQNPNHLLTSSEYSAQGFGLKPDNNSVPGDW